MSQTKKGRGTYFLFILLLKERVDIEKAKDEIERLKFEEAA